jgi:hypothetical protein
VREATDRRAAPAATCESCGRRPANEVLHRRPSRLAEITKQRIEPEVLVCRLCWLDILCSRKEMPPERDVTTGLPAFVPPGPARAPRSWALHTAARVLAGRAAVREHLRRTRGTFRHLDAAYSAALEARMQGRDDQQQRAAFVQIARAIRQRAALAQKARADRAERTPRAGFYSRHSVAFQRLRAASDVLAQARADETTPARQERADFHEALAAFRHHVTNVVGRAQGLRESIGHIHPGP